MCISVCAVGRILPGLVLTEGCFSPNVEPPGSVTCEAEVELPPALTCGGFCAVSVVLAPRAPSGCGDGLLSQKRRASCQDSGQHAQNMHPPRLACSKRATHGVKGSGRALHRACQGRDGRPHQQELFPSGLQQELILWHSWHQEAGESAKSSQKRK